MSVETRNWKVSSLVCQVELRSPGECTELVLCRLSQFAKTSGGESLFDSLHVIVSESDKKVIVIVCIWLLMIFVLPRTLYFTVFLGPGKFMIICNFSGTKEGVCFIVK